LWMWYEYGLVSPYHPIEVKLKVFILQ
jgi:hypothetical protein